MCLGHYSGKVSLISFVQKNPAQPVSGKVEKEFIAQGISQNPRACNAISWNPSERNLIAAGYEAVKNESSLLIWDINKAVSQNMILEPVPEVADAFARVQSKPKPDLIFQPKQAFQKMNDDIYSLSWFPESENELLVGTDKYVCICDTRQSLNFKSSIEDVHNKQIQAIKFDPFDARRFAT